MQKLIKKSGPGSILVFTLLIMFILGVISFGVASVTLTELKNAGTTGKTTKAFQVADSTVEDVLKSIKDASSGETIQGHYPSATCSNGTIKGVSSSVAGGSSDITFYKDSAETLAACGDLLASVQKIKVTGTAAETTRAVEVAVASVAWVAPSSYSNGWQEFDNNSNNNSVGCYREPNGFVHLRGLVENTSYNSNTILTLPATCRPTKNVRFPASIAIASTVYPVLLNVFMGGGIDTSPLGTTIPTTGAVTWISLDGITFEGS